MVKEDYKSPYNFEKLSRYNPNSSIDEILSQDIYYGLKETGDNIAKITSKLYDNTIGVLANDKVKRGKFITVSATLLGGLSFAALFNYLGADFAHAKDYVAMKIASHSFKTETIAHAGFAFATFMSLSIPRYMKQGYSLGKSITESFIDLAVLTAVSAPLSLIAYNDIREILVTHDIANGVDPRWAVLKAQGKLVLPYYISVISANKLVRYFITDRLGLTNGNGKKYGTIDSKDKTNELLIKNRIDKTIDNKVDIAS